MAFFYDMGNNKGTQKRSKIWSLFIWRMKTLSGEDRINTSGSLTGLQESHWRVLAVVRGRIGCPRWSSAWEVKESLAISSIRIWSGFFFPCVWVPVCMWGCTCVVYMQKPTNSPSSHFSHACHLFVWETWSLIGGELYPVAGLAGRPTNLHNLHNQNSLRNESLLCRTTLEPHPSQAALPPALPFWCWPLNNSFNWTIKVSPLNLQLALTNKFSVEFYEAA